MRPERRFLRSAEAWPDRLAVDGAGGPWRYRDLAVLAGRIAASLPEARGDASAAVVVLAERGGPAFAAILGTLIRGLPVVPLSVADPPGRLATLIARSGARVAIVDEVGADRISGVVSPLETPPRVLALGEGTARDLPLASAADLSPPADPSPIAQVLFTSGTTGAPRAVEVRASGLAAFLDAVRSRWRFAPTDRFSQLHELSFDLHGFDLFVALDAGACVVVPTRGGSLLGASWARRHGVTVWLSSPSVGELARRIGDLRPGSLPDLRWVGFCGEALPDEVAAAWAAAAPNAEVHDLYGPTELTIACTAHRWQPGEAVGGLVPIGEPLDGVRIDLVDAAGRSVPDGIVGELVATGAQLARGYRGDPAATAAAFGPLGVRPGRWYRTGDRAWRPRAGAPLCFVGRDDDQVQVRGHRVELRGIEAELRAIDGVSQAAVVPWPVRGARVEGLAAFVVTTLPPERLRMRIAERLPTAAIPRRVEPVDRLPLTDRGKVDRDALRARLDEGVP